MSSSQSPAKLAEREIEQESRYVHKLYARLDELRREKREQLESVTHTNYAGTHQNRSERDAFATLYADRLAQLEAVDERLVFGRLDLDDGDRRYIGRIGLSTPDLQILQVDWRAPEASSFYQATAHDRQRVRRRRHLILKGREVMGIEDEVLDLTLGAGDDEVIVRGEGALMTALNEKRTGRMSDIVGTIQSEQDRIIRAPLTGVRVVQGGPGTGKTAVALHRAAYLLYTYRERLKSAGVLLVGPSQFFMDYIERVLPSLGETGVVMSSLGELFPGIHAQPDVDPAVAEIKGRPVMAEVIRNAVRDREHVPERKQVLSVGSNRLTLTPRQVKHAIEKARATGKTHNEARLTFVKTLIHELTEELTEQLEESSGHGNTVERNYLAEDVRTSRDVRVALNLAWMPVDAKQLVSDLFKKPQRLARAAEGLLTPAEQELLLRSGDSGTAENPWRESDVPLLDEAAELLGEIGAGLAKDRSVAERAQQHALEGAQSAVENANRHLAEHGMDGIVDAQMLVDFNAEGAGQRSAAERAAQDRTWAYGHIVVDEAQELSQMQWRMLMRKNPLKSFTVVGDIAQTSSPAGALSWDAALEPFVKDRWHLEELTVNYRTPAQIMDAAVRMAKAAGLEITVPTAVREGQWAPVVQRLAEDADLNAELVKAVEEETRVLEGGLVAVIARANRVPGLHRSLQERFGDRVGFGAGGFGQDILVLDPHEAKGLEFDGVVVVEPDELIESAERARGSKTGRVGPLYVAMTRPTQRLHLIGKKPMPAGIEA